MAGVQTTPEHNGAPRMRCVALCVGSGELPPDLAAALLKRAVPTVVRRNVFDALADLCAERTPAALIIIEPDTTARSAELLDAATRYAPHATVWRYDNAATERLRAFVPAPAPSTARESQPETVVRHDAMPKPATSARPALRLAHVEEHDAPFPREPVEQSPSSILSEEEIAMLLNDEPDRGGGAR